MKKSKTQYLKTRKLLIQEEREIIHKRTLLNKRIREIQGELNSYDNWLINSK